MATRRLPVIQEPTGEDAGAASRPAWQWSLIGSGLLVTIWTPTVGVVLAVARKLAASRQGAPALGPSLAAVLVAATFALAGIAAGYLVARFGRRTQLRHVIGAGLLASLEIWALAWLGGAFTSIGVAVSALLSLGVLGGAFCALGAGLVRLGRRKKSAA
jgi:hypothetical protein